MKSLPGIFAIALTLALTACSEEQAEAPAAPPAKIETAPPAAAPDSAPAENASTDNDGAGARAEPFFAQMVLRGVTFQVESPNYSSINQVTVRAEGPEGPIGQMEAEADGTITNVEIEDLNSDGYPEIYVYVTSAGSGSYGSLIAYASNRNKSLSQIYLPSI